MRILTAPKVYLIARPQIVEDGLQAFLTDQKLEWPTSTDNVKGAERLVEVAGRCCYMSFGKKAGSKTNRKYIQNLLGRNDDGSFKAGPAHGSVCEHPCWSFLIVGAGRGFSHEQVRHRTGWAYSQLSTRYCDFEREEEEGTWEPGFCIPPLAQLDENSKNAFADKIKKSQQAYCELLSLIENDLKNNEKFMDTLSSYDERERKRMLRKAARGAARDILPIATEAIMVMSANARAIWNCIYLRANEHAEAVIREIYVQIAKIMEKEMPALFNGLKYEKCWDGSEVVLLPRDKL
jgi:thymidylate synthase (FAD)